MHGTPGVRKPRRAKSLFVQPYCMRWTDDVDTCPSRQRLFYFSSLQGRRREAQPGRRRGMIGGEAARQGFAVQRDWLQRAIEASVPQPALRQATFEAMLDVLQGNGEGFAALQGKLSTCLCPSRDSAAAKHLPAGLERACLCHSDTRKQREQALSCVAAASRASPLLTHYPHHRHAVATSGHRDAGRKGYRSGASSRFLACAAGQLHIGCRFCRCE
eukprot:scaffold7994_cov122-Isochrysis_galbana.AAC.1